MPFSQLMELSWSQKFVGLAVALPASLLLLYLLFRKDDEDDDDERHRLATSRQIVIEVIVPQKAVGSIIGREGANIKKIQEQSGARLHFKDNIDEGEGRVVIIRGSPQSAQSAELLIRDLISSQPEIVTKEIHVPVKALGRIIGQNGDTIRSMSRQSKAKIVIDRGEERDPNSLKKVSITGTREAVTLAEGIVEEKVKEHEAFQSRLATGANRRQQKSSGRPEAPAWVPMSLREEVPKSPEERDDLLQCNNFGESGDPSEAASRWNAELSNYDHRDYLKVCVSAVEHPGHFWIQVINSKSVELDRLVEQMTEYYNIPPTETDLNVALRVGDIVAAPFQCDASWYRARVNEVGEDKIDLYYIDFGDSIWLNKNLVRPLRGDFLSLLPQAVECSLARVQPINDSWSEDAICAFEDLSHKAEWRVLFAKIIHYQQTQRGGSMPCLELTDTSEEKDVNVGDELVRRGLAKFAGNLSSLRPTYKSPKKLASLFASIQHGTGQN